MDITLDAVGEQVLSDSSYFPELSDSSGFIYHYNFSGINYSLDPINALGQRLGIQYSQGAPLSGQDTSDTNDTHVGVGLDTSNTNFDTNDTTYATQLIGTDLTANELTRWLCSETKWDTANFPSPPAEGKTNEAHLRNLLNAFFNDRTVLDNTNVDPNLSRDLNSNFFTTFSNLLFLGRQNTDTNLNSVTPPAGGFTNDSIFPSFATNITAGGKTNVQLLAQKLAAAGKFDLDTSDVNVAYISVSAGDKIRFAVHIKTAADEQGASAIAIAGVTLTLDVTFA